MPELFQFVHGNFHHQGVGNQIQTAPQFAYFHLKGRADTGIDMSCAFRQC